jgi:hypothetical protein
MPLNFFNHGFYNVNPTWFFDFYPLNGFEILHFQGISNAAANPVFFELPQFDRFQNVPENSIAVVVAKRSRAQALKVPMQYKYKMSPKLGND